MYKFISCDCGKPVITVDELAKWLKLPANLTTLNNDVLTNILTATIAYAEKYTRIDISTKVYKLLEDKFPCEIEILKSKLVEVTEIGYTNVAGDVVIIDPANYYIIEGLDYDIIAPVENYTWPTDVNYKRQSVYVEFTAGFSATDSRCSIPADLRIAILTHAAKVYETRGDCGCDPELCGVPGQAKSTYNQYKILRLGV